MAGIRPKAGKPMVHSGRGGLRGLNWVKEEETPMRKRRVNRAAVEWVFLLLAFAIVTVLLVFFKR